MLPLVWLVNLGTKLDHTGNSTLALRKNPLKHNHSQLGPWSCLQCASQDLDKPSEPWLKTSTFKESNCLQMASVCCVSQADVTCMALPDSLYSGGATAQQRDAPQRKDLLPASTATRGSSDFVMHLKHTYWKSSQRTLKTKSIPKEYNLCSQTGKVD